MERRRLHNLVQELRGNIRVYIRVKPATPSGIVFSRPFCDGQAGRTSWPPADVVRIQSEVPLT